MANTTSLAFPNMFDVARNRLATLEDSPSIVNRTRLLILSEPTELYNEPNFGVGLKRHLWQYNTDNQKSIIKDRIVEQVRLHEPYCIPEETQFADGLLFTGTVDSVSSMQDHNRLKMTVALKTTYNDTANIDFNNEEVHYNG